MMQNARGRRQFFRAQKSCLTEVRQPLWHRKVCKPGSVLTAIYLAPQLLTGSSRLLGTVGRTNCPSTALLRDRVYIVEPMSPWAGCALTAPFHPYLVDWPMGKPAGRYLSVALVLRFPSAGVTRYPCPVEPGLSSSGPFRFPSAAVQPSLRKYSTPKFRNCQIPLKKLFETGILKDMRYEIQDMR